MHVWADECTFLTKEFFAQKSSLVQALYGLNPLQANYMYIQHVDVLVLYNYVHVHCFTLRDLFLMTSHILYLSLCFLIYRTCIIMSYYSCIEVAGMEDIILSDTICGSVL